MAEVTAALVKELREKTGAGMMDCKRALGDSGGDIEAAVDWLRKKGLAAAANKAGRVAAEGLIGVATRGPVGAVIEVNSETDFVARNKEFQSFVQGISGLALDGDGAIELLKEVAFPGSSRTVEAELAHLISTIGENLVLRRLERLSTGQGAVFPYVHNALGPGIGKIGVIVALTSIASADQLAAVGKQLAMHIAAASPLYLDIASVPRSALDRERDVLRGQARASGKPEGIIEKMVDGRLRKFYEEVVLLEQIFVVDQQTRIVLDVQAGHLLDQPAITRDRYVTSGPPATVPLTISVTAPGAVATPPSTSTAAPGITEDILASQEPGLTTQQTQATVSGKTAPGATVDIAVSQPGTKGNTTVIVQTVAGDGSFRAVVRPRPARASSPCPSPPEAARPAGRSRP